MFNLVLTFQKTIKLCTLILVQKIFIISYMLNWYLLLYTVVKKYNVHAILGPVQISFKKLKILGLIFF